jgi:toxin ParE1/3/4
MMKYKLTKQADQDLEEVFLYTKSQWGLYQAEKYVQEAAKIFNGLAELQNLGVSVGYIFEGARKIVIGKHLVFYKIQDEIVLILRVLYQNQDFDQVNFEPVE